jgi:predicted transcriptional regulator
VKAEDLPDPVKKRPTALLILMHLQRKKKERTITEIAQDIHVTEAAVSKSVDLLCEHNLVEKTHGIGKKGRRTTVAKLKH